MRFIVSLISLLWAFSFAPKVAAALEFTKADAEEALRILDQAIASRHSYIDNRQAAIDSLVDTLVNEPDSPELLMRIAQSYDAFNNDSALHYLQKGLEATSGEDRIPFQLMQASLLPLTGAFETARTRYESISPDSVPARLMPLFYDAGRRMYSYMAAFSPDDSPQKKSYSDNALALQEALIDILPKDSKEYRFQLGEYSFLTGQKGKALALLEEIFDSEPSNSNLRARAAHHLSAIAKDEGAASENAYIYYIAGAALADITAATREVAAIQELGNFLYRKNDVDRSYDYLNVALASAVECGASLRMIESSRTLPLIERAKLAQIARKERTIYIIVGILILILLGLIAIMIIRRHELRRMRVLQNRLKDANRLKELYISQFLGLCSIYMDKLNQFCKITNRKIATGNIDDLSRLIKSGKFIEEQSAEFYEVFDTAFLHMYPEFPAKVNALLRPDARIIVEADGRLNSDLRILAFMRLGIEESGRIARALGLSVNTVYAYRARTKARAINRDTFEADIMKISSTF